MKKNERNMQIDIVKGIGIILVVLGHASFPYIHFVYLFHLAIFFIISGYFFKDEYVKDSENLKKFIINKIKRLYLPFIIGNIICVILNNIFIDINLYSNLTHQYYSKKDIFINIIKILLFKGTTEMLGATWFLQILFLIMIFYAVIEFLIKKFKYRNLIQISISILLLIIGYFLAIKNINIKIIPIQVFTCYILFDIGRRFKNIKFEINFKIKFIFMILSFIILIFLNKCGTIELSLNQYTNILYFICVSIFGWIFVYELSYYIKQIKFINKIVQYIGINTMPILILHFIIFKFVNIVGILVLNKDLTLMKNFPVVFSNGYWWIVYSVLGITIPLLIDRLLKTICKKIAIKKELNI